MEEDLDLIIDNEDKRLFEGKRPVFLTVLCILTFIGAGYGVISGLIGIYTMGAMEDLRTSLLTPEAFGGDDFGMDLENMYRWSKIAQLLALAGSIFCLGGALFMWNLKKFGYFIYVLGQILPIVGAFFVAPFLELLEMHNMMKQIRILMRMRLIGMRYE